MAVMEKAEGDARKIMDRLRAATSDPRLDRVVGTYLFDVAGVGQLRIAVDHGRLEVREGDGDADCIVKTDATQFVRVMTGQQNLVTAFMQGLVEIHGDAALAYQLHGLLPAPASGKEASP